jgi:hypothetical protein
MIKTVEIQANLTQPTLKLAFERLRTLLWELRLEKDKHL